jgi:hypothetical protein
VIVAIASAFGHIPTNLFEDSSILVQVVKQVAKAIGASLHLSLDVLWALETQRDILTLDMNDVMEVVGEASHLLRDFGLGFVHGEDGFASVLANEF